MAVEPHSKNPDIRFHISISFPLVETKLKQKPRNLLNTKTMIFRFEEQKIFEIINKLKIVILRISKSYRYIHR